MFTGLSGTGKTSYAKLVRKDFKGTSVVINASNERSIQSINYKDLIKYQLIILDECDNLPA